MGANEMPGQNPFLTTAGLTKTSLTTAGLTKTGLRTTGLRTTGLTTTGLTVIGLLLTATAPTIAATLSVADLTANDLVVTEYLANPVGVSDTSGEYFEIYNRTLDGIDLAGLIVRDDGSNTFTVSSLTGSSLLLPAGGFAVFANSDGVALGLSPAYMYGSAMALTNSADEIGLYRPDDTLINKVMYSDGDSFGAGIAHELDVISASLPSVTGGPTLGSDFIAATAILNLGNFGSPGAAGNTRLAAPAVPLPAGAWLLSSALALLAGRRKRKDPA
jgi:hypothetical protein